MMNKKSSDVYKTYQVNDYRKIFVMGDAHGSFDLIKKFTNNPTLFNKETDLLVAAGDIIDRGSQSLNCLRLLNEKWFDMVIGNHELMAIDYVLQGNISNSIWMNEFVGGAWYLSLNQEEKDEVKILLEKVEMKPYIIEFKQDDKRICLAHANYPSNQYENGKLIDLSLTAWDITRYREAKSKSLFYDPVTIFGTNLFVFGHYQTEAPEQHKNCLWIDTAAYRTGNLTFLDVTNTIKNIGSPKFFQIN